MKVIVLATLLAAVHAGNLILPAPTPLLRATSLPPAPVVAKTVAFTDDYDPNPQYSYAYDIQDALTGDSKNHFESRNGDAVQGSYSLIDADGTRRIVEYTADPVNGFNAVVHKEPLAAPIASPVAYAAPVPSRLGFAAPLARIAAPALSAKAILH